MDLFNPTFTKHACERSLSRSIPPGVVDLILEYGEPVKARDGAHKVCLSRTSLRTLKRVYGRPITSVLAAYRDVYVVLVDGRVVTVARAAKPLVH